MEDFQDRMFMAGEAVYAAIERGEHPDVQAELMKAQFEASESE